MFSKLLICITIVVSNAIPLELSKNVHKAEIMAIQASKEHMVKRVEQTMEPMNPVMEALENPKKWEKVIEKGATLCTYLGGFTAGVQIFTDMYSIYNELANPTEPMDEKIIKHITQQFEAQYQKLDRSLRSISADLADVAERIILEGQTKPSIIKLSLQQEWYNLWLHDKSHTFYKDRFMLSFGRAPYEAVDTLIMLLVPNNALTNIQDSFEILAHGSLELLLKFQAQYTQYVLQGLIHARQHCAWSMQLDPNLGPNHCHNHELHWNASLLKISAASNVKINTIQTFETVLKEAKLTVIDYVCANTDMNVVVLELTNILIEKYYKNVWAVLSWPFPIDDDGFQLRREKAWVTRDIYCDGKVTHTVMIMFDSKSLAIDSFDVELMKEQLSSIPLSTHEKANWWCWGTNCDIEKRRMSQDIANQAILEDGTIAYVVTRNDDCYTESNPTFGPRSSLWDYYTHESSSSMGVTVFTVQRKFGTRSSFGHYCYTLTGVTVNGFKQSDWCMPCVSFLALNNPWCC